MTKLSEFLRRLKKERDSNRRIFRHGDPAKGLEYNEINTAYLVSSKIWSVDIARTPQVIREIGERVDVHGEAWNINKMESMINYRSSKCRGRGR